MCKKRQSIVVVQNERCYVNPNDPMLLLLDNSDSPSIVEQ